MMLKQNSPHVVIITEDFRFHYLVCLALSGFSLPHTSISPGHPIPSDVGIPILIILKKDLETINIQYKNKSSHIISIDQINLNNIKKTIKMEIIHEKSNKNKSFQILKIGIDPGYNVGIAAWGDRILIYTNTLKFDLQSILSIITGLIRDYAANDVIIRVGAGSPIDIHLNIIRSIQKALPNSTRLELVDESFTSQRIPILNSKNKEKKSNDALSAAQIALRKGKKVPNSSLGKSATNGRLREIQTRSRAISKGELTISKTLSQKVANGELSLEEAIQIQKRENKKKNI